jgi:hypothetical protein
MGSADIALLNLDMKDPHVIIGLSANISATIFLTLSGS